MKIDILKFLALIYQNVPEKKYILEKQILGLEELIQVAIQNEVKIEIH